MSNSAAAVAFGQFQESSGQAQLAEVAPAKVNPVLRLVRGMGNSLVSGTKKLLGPYMTKDFWFAMVSMAAQQALIGMFTTLGGVLCMYGKKFASPELQTTPVTPVAQNPVFSSSPSYHRPYEPVRPTSWPTTTSSVPSEFPGFGPR